MADNFNATEGSGKVFAADDIGGVLHQRMKLRHGVDGTNDGDVAITNPLPTRQGNAENMLALKTIAFGSITGSFADTVLGTITNYSIVEVWNDTDGTLQFSWDAGVTVHHIMPPRAARTLRIKASASALHVKYTVAPTTGNLYLEPVK